MGRGTGPDLKSENFAKSPSRGWSHKLYWDPQQTQDALRASLECAYPGLAIAGMEPSVFRPLAEEEKGALCGRVAKSGADFLWVALGAPRQEVLCHELNGRVPALMVGVGGAFNVLAGRVPEAPRWMQDIGLEWLYRLVQEPRRLFKRYAVTNTKFIAYQLMGAKRRKGSA